ncbi:DUF4192 domain-containing protein [Actinophytocola glycyrrhizae]|uniref:DUF4192 domain-containing protein n=1 Tax=Actinophytocola glycyrrhizae TaxID=2044873 RepID=A0ABV9SE60_9PSEU
MTGHANFPDARRRAGVITSTGELIGLVPLMLGFRPVNSLVLVAHSGVTVSGLIRTDLPGSDGVHEFVAQLRDALVTGGARSVTVLMVRGDTTAQQARHNSVPARALIDALNAVLPSAEITIRHCVSAPTTETGAPWHCHDLCQCHGTVPALDSSPVAASLIASGATASGSREQLAATLAADPDEHLQRRIAMLNCAQSPAARMSTASPERGYRTVREAVAAAATHPALPTFTDEQIVDLALALSHPGVRDRCLTASLPTSDAGAEAERADAAQRLWTVLTRAVPGPARAEPATLLAAHAYLRGDGVLASIALEIAQDANPAHALAHLLNLAIQKGIPPTQLRRLLVSAVTTHP